MKPINLAPSILSADFSRLGAHIEEVLQAGITHIHVDVMDGHFVPSISFGPLIAKAIRPLLTRHNAIMDVHLMVTNPEQHLAPFVDAGADIITVHVETCADLPKTIRTIHSLGAKAGVTLNPATPLAEIKPILPEIDLALVMSVVPGLGGQSYLPQSIARIRALRALLDSCNPDAILEVDGGIKPENAAEIAAAGANLLVVGSAIFGGCASVTENIRRFRTSLCI